MSAYRCFHCETVVPESENHNCVMTPPSDRARKAAEAIEATGLLKGDEARDAARGVDLARLSAAVADGFEDGDMMLLFVAIVCLMTAAIWANEHRRYAPRIRDIRAQIADREALLVVLKSQWEAQGMSAGTAKTEGLGAMPASPTPQGDAPDPTPYRSETNAE